MSVNSAVFTTAKLYFTFTVHDGQAASRLILFWDVSCYYSKCKYDITVRETFITIF